MPSLPDDELMKILVSRYGMTPDQAKTYAEGLSNVQRADPLKQAMHDMIASTARFHAASTDPNSAIGHERLSYEEAGKRRWDQSKALAASADLNDKVNQINSDNQKFVTAAGQDPTTPGREQIMQWYLSKYRPGGPEGADLEMPADNARPFVMPPAMPGPAPFAAAASQGFADVAKRNPSKY